MPRVAPVVPAESDVLCEGCGYTLNGLPQTGRCPECGRAIGDSVDPNHRTQTSWERASTGWFKPFVQTSFEALFRPTRFFRSLQTRAPSDRSGSFAAIHWFIASALFGAAAAGHYAWFLRMRGPDEPLWFFALYWFVGTFSSFVGIAYLTRIAAKLTTWEAGYRGIRLPRRTVLRGMHYHAAHYVPVAVVAMLTVWGYRLLLANGKVGVESATTYLYLLCGEVIVSAVYLFHTYWIGMRNMMYANR